MKKSTLVLTLVMAGSAFAVDNDPVPMVAPRSEKPFPWLKLAKVATGAGLTFGYGYLLYKHILVDMAKPKGYVANFTCTPDYIQQNIDKMCIDLLKIGGFSYLTWLSGSYMLAKVGALTKQSAQGQNS